MPKRSLMLAGGGVKIAFQAGVLQVWLDEAGIEFDHADAVSAACFNLAMWVQGFSGTQIADNWRNTDPLKEVDLNLPQLARFLYAASLFDLDAFRQRIFPAWGLDWEKIKSSPRQATFNIYNFSRHQLRPVTPSEMTEDMLIAAGSLPMWFPPVRIQGDTYIDAVFNTGSNLEEAIRRGADELWVIWTTSQRGEWFDGFVGNFFGIFEATTVGGYKRVLERIERNNQALAQGQAGEFGRPITVRELKAEVPVHYLFNFSKDRAAEAVNRGVEAARAWCDAQNIARRPGPVVPVAAAVTPQAPESLRFSETFKGFFGFGATACQAGFDQGRSKKTSLKIELEIQIHDLNQFITMPEHEAQLSGTVACERLGGERPIQQGVLRLLIDQGDPTQKKVSYRILFRDGGGRALLLTGEKDLSDKPGSDVEQEDTEVLAKIWTGSESGELLGAGIVQIGAWGMLKQLASFRVEAPNVAARAAALARLGEFYFGRLWDVYARHILPVAPF
jgi:predicted patatin/cPLA2 family phospholipase